MHPPRSPLASRAMKLPTGFWRVAPGEARDGVRPDDLNVAPAVGYDRIRAPVQKQFQLLEYPEHSACPHRTDSFD